MYENVLVPINKGKLTNMKCIREAEEIVDPDGVIHVLYVDPDGELDAEESKVMEHVNEELNQSKYDHTVRSVEGDPTDEIIEYNNKIPIDVIVMYTYDKTGIQKLITGSYTEEIINKTDVPVLVLSDSDN